MAGALLDNATRVETPEHVAFAFRIAGPWQRVTAYVLDTVFRLTAFVLLVLLGGLWSSVVGEFGEALAAQNAVLLLAWFVLEWFYGVGFEWLWDGRTPGKRLTGLRVVRDDGRPIGAREAFLRNLLRAADLLPPIVIAPTYLVGLVVSALDPRFRRLGDLAAGTVVVVEELARMSEAVDVHPPARREELAALPARPRLSVDERRVLESFMRRATRYSDARREEIARPWADHLARRFGSERPRSAMRYLELLYVRVRDAAPQEAR